MKAVPHSTTTLYRLSYSLENLPELYVVDMQTLSDISCTPPKLEDVIHDGKSSD
jgi:hypothetical protein